MRDSLKKLYQQVILERQKSNAGFKKRDDAEIIIKAYNPLCGDKFNIYLDFEGDKVVQASYHGYGCALSKASTSLMVETIMNKSVSELILVIEDYLKKLRQDHEHSEELVKALALARNFPGREQCTVLSWDALKTYLKNKTDK